MAVPTRVRRGTSSGDPIYYWDGVNPMTLLGGGVGGTLSDDFGVGLVGTLSATEFDTMQTYLVERKEAFDALAACGICPIEPAELSEGAQSIVTALAGGG